MKIPMKLKIAPRLPFYIGLLFGIFLLGLGAKELFAVGSAAVLAEQDAQLERDWDFKVHLKNVDILLKDAELLAYGTSGQGIELSQPEQLKQRCDAEFRALSLLLGDNAVQKANVEKFRVLVNRQLLQLADAAGSAPQKPAPARAGSPDGADDLKALLALEGAMEAEQSALIMRREEQIRERYRATLALCFAGSVIFMALLVIFYRINQRYFAQLRRSRNELESKNDNLKNAIALRADQLAALSHHLLAVSEQEKASLARELHDELGSNLTAIRLDLLAMMEQIKKKEPCLAAQLGRTLQVLQRTYDIKRRIIEDLHPSMLENLGLAAAVRAYSDEVAQRSGLQIEVDMDDSPVSMDAERAIAMYRIIQESLTNTLKYAKASRVSIRLVRGARGLLLRIVDDGTGFAAGALGKPKAHGIVGMRERAVLLDGTFHIGGGEGGCGTCIDVFLPYKYADDKPGPVAA